MRVDPEVVKKSKGEWVKPAYRDIRLGFEYTLYAMTR
jgi:coenzyme PQQ precursor peptide PqqA